VQSLHYLGFFTKSTTKQSVNPLSAHKLILSPYWLLLILLFTFHISPFTASSQTRSQIESAVRGMSQDDIDKKLKELGMSREEAIRRARENGISVEDYLGRFQAFTAPTDTSTQQMGAPSLVRSRVSPFDTLRTRKIGPILGFSNRLGADSLLQPFGYDVFQYPASTFEPLQNVATSATYVLGPGDELAISVWGETKLSYQLAVNREGSLVIPEVGPVSANGQTIQQFKERLVRRMTAAYSGLKNGAPNATTFLDISVGKLRGIQVFVLGEVTKPGGYTVSSMSTAFHAIYLAGGPTVNGSLRDIQIRRTGESPIQIDLYDYLIFGDKSKDVRLQDGDVVFVKPVKKRVAVVGRILRPAIYEIKDKESLGDLINLAGGLMFDSYFDHVHVERIIPFDQRRQYKKNILDIDLEFRSVRELRISPSVLEDGDIMRIQKISDLPENRVSIHGNVRQPGVYQWKEGMRMKDLILLADSLQRNTFSERGTLFRMLPNLRREIFSFNPRLALVGVEPDNMPLQNEDSVLVYKESQFFPTQNVQISGAVRKPGTYTRFEKMTVADLVILAGGITESASLIGWEVARMDTTKIGTFSEIFKFGVDKEYWNNKEASSFLLRDLDQVNIPFEPKYTLQKSVTVSGYVMYPGMYTIKLEQDRVFDMIQRAGGLKPGYYLEGSRLIRKENGAGLVPINFLRVQSDPNSADNIIVADGDSIHIASKDNVVYVRGEVFVPSAVVYKKEARLGYYIKQAGGYKEEADAGRTVVSLPNGMKWEEGWFIFPDPDILGGSTVYVPRKIEKEDKTLPVLRDMATILASLAAITIAIVQVTK